jgi:hypothetical protein
MRGISYLNEDLFAAAKQTQSTPKIGSKRKSAFPWIVAIWPQLLIEDFGLVWGKEMNAFPNGQPCSYLCGMPMPVCVEEMRARAKTTG